MAFASPFAAPLLLLLHSIAPNESDAIIYQNYSPEEDETAGAVKRSEYDSDDEEHDDAELSNSSPEDIEDYPVRAKNNRRARKPPPKRSRPDRKKKRSE